jgi:hypothetical protein
MKLGEIWLMLNGGNGLFSIFEIASDYALSSFMILYFDCLFIFLLLIIHLQSSRLRASIQTPKHIYCL